MGKVATRETALLGADLIIVVQRGHARPADTTLGDSRQSQPGGTYPSSNGGGGGAGAQPPNGRLPTMGPQDGMGQRSPGQPDAVSTTAGPVPRRARRMIRSRSLMAARIVAWKERRGGSTLDRMGFTPTMFPWSRASKKR